VGCGSKMHIAIESRRGCRAKALESTESRSCHRNQFSGLTCSIVLESARSNSLATEFAPAPPAKYLIRLKSSAASFFKWIVTGYGAHLAPILWQRRIGGYYLSARQNPTVACSGVLNHWPFDQVAGSSSTWGISIPPVAEAGEGRALCGPIANSKCW
jgi:hypothetical protein